MELNEIKNWAEHNADNYYLKMALIIVVEKIYEETNDRITDINLFYAWFKEKWNECYNLISRKENWFKNGESINNFGKFSEYYVDLTFPLALRTFIKTWIVDNFNIKTDIKENVTVNVRSKKIVNNKTIVNYNNNCKVFYLIGLCEINQNKLWGK